MTDPTLTNADDGLERAMQANAGVLADELGTRQLAYRRALENHLLEVTGQLALQQATRDPSVGPPAHDPLPRSWARVREARNLRDAAADAVRHYRATP